MRDYILPVILIALPSAICVLFCWQEKLSRRERKLAEREKVLLIGRAQQAAETQMLSTAPNAVLDIISLPLYTAGDLYVAGGCGEPDGTMVIVRGRN